MKTLIVLMTLAMLIVGAATSASSVILYQNDFGTAAQRVDTNPYDHWGSGTLPVFTDLGSAGDRDGDGLSARATTERDRAIYIFRKQIVAPEGKLINDPILTVVGSGNFNSLGSLINIYMCTDGVNWPYDSTMNYNDGGEVIDQILTVSGVGQQGLRSFWIRVDVRTDAGVPLPWYPYMENIQVTGDLVDDPTAPVDLYINDFGTAAQRTEMNPYGHWGSGTLPVWTDLGPAGDLDGDGLSARATSNSNYEIYIFTKQIIAPVGKLINDPVFTAVGSGNEASLGSSVVAYISLDGASNWVYDVTSNYGGGNVNGQTLTASCVGNTNFQGLQNFWIRADIRTNAGLPLTWYPTLENLRVTGVLIDTPEPQPAVPASTAKQMPDNAVVTVQGTVTAIFGDWFYVEQNDRSSGILVQTGQGVSVGQGVIVTGFMATTENTPGDLYDGGERYIKCTGTNSGDSAIITPVMMINKVVGGATLGDPAGMGGQYGAVGGTGLNNTGLLVKVTGRITKITSNVFFINDGSGVELVVTDAGDFPWIDGAYGIVTGVSSIYNSEGQYKRRVRCTTIDQTDVPALDFSKLNMYHTAYDFNDWHSLSVLPSVNVGFKGFRGGQHSMPMVYLPWSDPNRLSYLNDMLSAFDPSVTRVCIGEENIWWDGWTDLLNGIYDYTKANYPQMTEVFQWFSPGGGQYYPIVQIRADGWGMDEYYASGPTFRKYLMRHLVTGRKMFNCVWASPAGGGFGGYDQMIDYSQAQVDVCREFNIPMMFFCVTWPSGSTYEWLLSSDPEVVKWRNWLYGANFTPSQYPYFYPELDPEAVVNIAHATDTSQLPAASANQSVGDTISVSGLGSYTFTDGYADEAFMNNATIDGFLNLRWNFIGDKLITEPKPDGGPNVLNMSTLIYRFQRSFGSFNQISGRMQGTIKGTGAYVRIDLSTNGTNWQSLMTASGSASETSFDLTSSGGALSGGTLYVRIRSNVSESGDAFVKLDALTVNANRSL